MEATEWLKLLSKWVNWRSKGQREAERDEIEGKSRDTSLDKEKTSSCKIEGKEKSKRVDIGKVKERIFLRWLWSWRNRKQDHLPRKKGDGDLGRALSIRNMRDFIPFSLPLSFSYPLSFLFLLCSLLSFFVILLIISLYFSPFLSFFLTSVLFPHKFFSTPFCLFLPSFPSLCHFSISLSIEKNVKVVHLIYFNS